MNILGDTEVYGFIVIVKKCEFMFFCGISGFHHNNQSSQTNNK